MSTPAAWKELVIYQIYPASYADANGDGYGDLPGIISKLDYLRELGVSCLWVSPFFKGPQHDLGYDISDFTDVHAPYGTVADAEALIKGAHERGMKVIFDLVVNHTSDEHEWFIESASSKDNPKRDWFIWRPAKYVDGVRKPPNNWKTYFGESAWEWHEGTQEYYLHLFVRQQPDLNWENEDCRKAIYRDACNFWLDRGVDGFRIDTCMLYSKRPGLPDAPVTDPDSEYQFSPLTYTHGPRLHEFIAEMARETWRKYPGTFVVGESDGMNGPEHVLEYVGEDRKEFSMIFGFEHYSMLFKTFGQPLEWTLPQWKTIVQEHQGLTVPEKKGWTTVHLENHDSGRAINRFANPSPEHRVASAKVLAVYTLTLSGTSFLYQGQELGMVNMPASWPIAEYKDIWTQLFWEETSRKFANDPAKLEKSMQGVQKYARDHARTPMHWDGTEGAGFSPAGAAEPWMKVMDSSREINAAAQLKDPQSPFAFWKTMIALRKAHPDLFVYGRYEVVDYSNIHTISFLKISHADASKRAFVSLNFTDQERDLSVPEGLTIEELAKKEVLASSEGRKGADKLRPYEGRVYLL